MAPFSRRAAFDYRASRQIRLGSDDSGSKRVAVELIRDVGFEPVDAGPLRTAQYMEPFALFIGQLAYEGERGPELAYRFQRLGK